MAEILPIRRKTISNQSIIDLKHNECCANLFSYIDDVYFLNTITLEI